MSETIEIETLRGQFGNPHFDYYSKKDLLGIQDNGYGNFCIIINDHGHAIKYRIASYEHSRLINIPALWRSTATQDKEEPIIQRKTVNAIMELEL